MKKILTLFSVLLFSVVAHAGIPVNNCAATALTTSTVSCNLGTVTAGHSLIVGGASSGYQNWTPSDTNGDIFTPNPAGCGFDGGARILCLFIVEKAVGGPTTIVGTDNGGGSNSMSVVAAEYSGAATFPLDQFPQIIMQYSAGSLTTNPGTSVTSGDIAVAVGFVGNDSGASATYTASGYTSEVTSISSNNRTSIGLLDKTVSSATAGVTATVVSGSLDGAGLVMIRTNLPTVGSVQHAACSPTVTASFTCSTVLPVAGNDMIIASVFANEADDVTDSATPQISGMCSVPWRTGPFGYYGTPPGGTIVFYCPKATANATTLSISELGAYGNQNWDVYITEVTGLAQNTPIVGLTYNVVEGVTVNTNSIIIPSSATGSFYIYNLFADSYSPYQYVYTNTYSGATLVTEPLTQGNYTKQVNDLVVSSTGTYSQTITSSHIQSYATNLVFVLSTLDQTNVQIAQVTNGGGASGSSLTLKTFILPVISGDTLVAIGTWQPSQTLTAPTDTLGNSWTRICGSGSFYGAWYVPSSLSGMDTVTMNPSSITTSMKLMELTAGYTLDTSSCASLTGTSISPNQITTSQANELLIAFAGSSGSCNPPGANLAGGSTWVDIGGSGSHCADTFEEILSTTSTGTYGNAVSASPSTPLDGGIFGFYAYTPPPPSTTQPNVIFITENLKPKIFLYQGN